MAKIVSSVKNPRLEDIDEIKKIVNDNKTNLNSCLLQKLKHQNGQCWNHDAVGAGMVILK